MRALYYWRSLLLGLVSGAAIGGGLHGQTGPRVVEVRTREFASVLPDTLAAGLTTFRLRNEDEHGMYAQFSVP